MTCKDCIHAKVCDNLISQGLPWEDGKYPAEKWCDLFKNKADVVEVRHGHWESYLSPVSLNGDVYYKCSVCGEHDPWQHTTRGRAKFCPNCGAKMDGERRDQNEG